MWRTLFKAAAGAAGALAALKLTVSWAEPRMVFNPVKRLGGTPEARGLDYLEHRLRTADGETLVAWEIPHPEARAEVVFFHGNSGNLWLWLDFFKIMHDRGLAVTALDYRGYGDSTGEPSEKGLYRDVKALVRRHSQEIRQAGRPLIYWGRSLGGPLAAYAVSLAEPDGLILEATFPNKDSLLTHFPFYRALSPFSNYTFPTERFLQGRRCPVLVIHGDQDPVVPLAEGEKLYDAISAPKDFFLVPGAVHNDTQSVAPDLYWERIVHFAEQAVRPQSPVSLGKDEGL